MKGEIAAVMSGRQIGEKDKEDQPMNACKGQAAP
jgi:hypothetical protein